MTIVDAVTRMHQIESAMIQLSQPTAPASSAAPAASTASTFASTLAAAGSSSSATVTAPAGQLVSNGSTGATVVADAQKYLGVPYVFGGTSSAGLDCSGLVQRVYGDLGISVPRLVSGQSTIGQSVPSLADAQPGDLIVCNGGEHIAIYAGNGKIIQAPKPGGSVEEMTNWISPSNVVTIRRVVPTAPSPVSGTSASDPVTAALAQLMAGTRA